MNRITLILAAALLTGHTAPAEFHPTPYTNPGTGAGILKSADMDNDGRLDLVNQFNDLIYWQRNLGVTDLKQPPLAAPTLLAGVPADYLQIFDADFDGDLDFVGRTRNYPQNDKIFWVRSLLVENGTLSFEAGIRLISTYSDDVRALYHADLDMDGDEDLISCIDFGDEEFYWHENRLNTASANFAAPVKILDKGRYIERDTLTSGDVDNDGDIDICTRREISATSPYDHIVWQENRMAHNAGYGLQILDGLGSPSSLPSTSPTPLMVIARVNGELWFRFIAAGGGVTDYRETLLAGKATEIETIKSALAPYWSAMPPAFTQKLLKNQATRITLHKTGGTLAFDTHDIYSAMLPESLRSYSPNFFRLNDFDLDGDLDLFTAYFGSYGPVSGWYENRLNEAAHADFSTLRELPLIYNASNRLDACLTLEDVDNNGAADILYRGSDEDIHVVYNFLTERNEWSPWRETAVHLANYGATHGRVESLLCLDLDQDGDSDLIHTYKPATSDGRTRISENLTIAYFRNQFSRSQVMLASGIPNHDTYKTFIASDLDGDGDEDLYLKTQSTTKTVLRNAYGENPHYAFVADASLTTTPTLPPATSISTQFDSWLQGQSWKRVDTVISKLEVDLDQDGNKDIVMLHRLTYDETDLVWFRNTLQADGGFAGPYGISGNVLGDSLIACSDFDADGDLDVLAYVPYADPIGLTAILAFPNNLKRHPVTQLFQDGLGYFDYGKNHPDLTCTLKMSDDLNWSMGTSVNVSPAILDNPAALKKAMDWANPAYLRRFYRMLYHIETPE